MFHPASNHIHFHFITPPFYFPRRKELKNFVITLFKKEGHRVEGINYVFCTDEYLWQLNKKHLHHDSYTDIITFGLSGRNEPVSADVYISVERVRENAKIYATTFTKELHRVIFHGALHLCGFKDKTKGQSRLMRSKEDYYLSRYFVSRGKSHP